MAESVATGETIRIYHECEDGIEKFVPRITDWHLVACQVVTNGDPEGQIFLFHLHTNNVFFFLLTTKYLILYWKNMNKISRKSWISWNATWWRYFNITMISRIDLLPAFSRCVAVQFLSFPWAGTGMWVIIISHELKQWISQSGVREIVSNHYFLSHQWFGSVDIPVLILTHCIGETP